MNQSIYAIGDIHGQKAMLDQALLKIENDGGRDARIVFLGDFTDRGPDSKGVLDILIDGQAQGRDWHFVKGNHDRMFEWFLETPSRQDLYLPIDLNWLNPRLGGDTTLASYGIDMSIRWRYSDLHDHALQVVPRDHYEFLRDLPLTYETDDLLFVHAGIRPDVVQDQQTEFDLLWIRQEFHAHTDPFPKLVVHGHTPVGDPTHYGNRINLDTGAGYGKPLTTAVFMGTDCWVLTDDGRTPLSPA